MDENITGKRIKELRDKLGLFQSDLAEKLNMQRNNISRYEKGTVVPPLDILSKIADILHTSTDFLHGKTNDPLPFYSRLSLDFRELLSKMSKHGEFIDYIKKDVISALERFEDQFEGNFSYTPDELAKEMDKNYSLYFKGELYGDIADLAVKHGLLDGKNKNPDSLANETEFTSTVIELSDAEIINKFTLTIDGQVMDAKKMKRLIAFARMDAENN